MKIYLCVNKSYGMEFHRLRSQPQLWALYFVPINRCLSKERPSEAKRHYPTYHALPFPAVRRTCPAAFAGSLLTAKDAAADGGIDSSSGEEG